MKSILVLGAIIMVLPAWAGASTVEEKVDINKLTCKELMKGNDSDRQIGFSFYHGFLAGKKNSQEIDLNTAYQLTDSVKDYCLSNPTATVMEAFNKFAK